jgi:hypothetical protein
LPADGQQILLIYVLLKGGTPAHSYTKNLVAPSMMLGKKANDGQLDCFLIILGKTALPIPRHIQRSHRLSYVGYFGRVATSLIIASSFVAHHSQSRRFLEFWLKTPNIASRRETGSICCPGTT